MRLGRKLRLLIMGPLSWALPFSHGVMSPPCSVTVRALHMRSLISPLPSVINAWLNGQLVYSYLERMGIAEPIQVMQADMKSAVNRLINKNHKKVLNDFVGSCIRSMGVNHGSVPDEAYIIARQRAIRETFDYMIRNEINI